jgi:tryptophan-rich sensory protein
MSQTVLLKETITEELLPSADEINRSFMESIVIVFIAFLLILIVANNPNASYYELTLPSWAPSLFVWSILFFLVLFFAAYGAGRIKSGVEDTSSGVFRLLFWIILILVLLSIFMIFRQDNYRTAFWLSLIALVFVIIVMIMYWNKVRAGALWMIPLALGLLFYLVEVWNIISLNNL